jgi:hypothetical protein
LNVIGSENDKADEDSTTHHWILFSDNLHD